VTPATCPILLLQALRDPVVPLTQAVAILAELTEQGTEHRYLSFADEADGFRHLRVIQACFEAGLLQTRCAATNSTKRV
jgi:dipeptidyl aminopeptidase/acylaminoacyl peptidase